MSSDLPDTPALEPVAVPDDVTPEPVDEPHPAAVPERPVPDAHIGLYTNHGPVLWAVVPGPGGLDGWNLAADHTEVPAGVNRAVVRGLLEHGLARLAAADRDTSPA